MIQVCGYAAQQAKSPLRPYTFERREPRDDDVVIDIQYCGICHSDIHQVNNGWGVSTYPMVPGHEIVGIVSQVGTKVTGYKVGDRVGIGNFVGSCRKCGPCHRGLEQYCVEGATWTYNAVEREDGKKLLRLKEVILIKSLLMKDMSFGFRTTFLWIAQLPFFARASRFIRL